MTSGAMGRAIGLTALMGLAILVGNFAAGCASVVYVPAKVPDPVPVYLAEYNVHSTILFPCGKQYVDYSFGDWNYAALRHKFINDAVGALTISGESTLERRLVDVDPRTGEPILKDNPDLLIRLYAQRTLVEQRRAELESRFQHDLSTGAPRDRIDYPSDNEIFVKDGEHYSLSNNCNHMTAETLRALGYRVEGNVVTNQFHLETRAGF